MEITVPSYELTSGYQLLVGNYDEAEELAAKKELQYNHYGHIPLISTLSGMVRCMRGIEQVILGVAKGAFALIKAAFFTHEFSKNTVKPFFFAVHGISNITRGACEAYPILGNIVTIIYDQIGLRLKYGIESQKHIDPNTATWLKHGTWIIEAKPSMF